MTDITNKKLRIIIIIIKIKNDDKQMK